MRIDSYGNVGIGTTSPSYVVDVSPLSGVTSDLFIVVLSTTGTGLIVKNNDNVGIGTTSPFEKLHVNGYVKAKGYKTSDIIFEKDGNSLWRMYKDEDGLYLKSLQTGEVYRFVLQKVENK